MMKKWYFVFTLLLILSVGSIFFVRFFVIQPKHKEEIKVGILHSLTGTMAISERAVVDATLMAIEEINQQGGVLGKLIKPLVVDGKSDNATFAREAERLIAQEKVVVIFGCWTSASRKTVKPVIEKYNHLLFYPVQYEGLEQSPNIIYTGAAPNQQIIPGVKWCFDNLGKRFFLVGSDYVFPRTANEIIKELVTSLGGEIIGEEYIVLGSSEVSHIVEKIIKTKPDVILNTINGDSNIPFFKQLRAAGITPEKIPTMSFSIAEPELEQLGLGAMIGDYATWNYFQRVDRAENQNFVNAFKKKYGTDRVVSDPMEAAYFGVYLWSQAVNEAGTTDIVSVRTTLKQQAYNAPGGIVYIDEENQHAWKLVRIGKIRSDKQFNILWNSRKPVRPVPYPVFKDKVAWDSFLNELYEQWGKKWAKEAA